MDLIIVVAAAAACLCFVVVLADSLVLTHTVAVKGMEKSTSKTSLCSDELCDEEAMDAGRNVLQVRHEV